MIDISSQLNDLMTERKCDSVTALHILFGGNNDGQLLSKQKQSIRTESKCKNVWEHTKLGTRR